MHLSIPKFEVASGIGDDDFNTFARDGYLIIKKPFDMKLSMSWHCGLGNAFSIPKETLHQLERKTNGAICQRSRNWHVTNLYLRS